MRKLPLAAAALALIGATAIGVAALRGHAGPPETAGTPVAAPDTVAATPQAGPGTGTDELTTGPVMSTSAPVRVSIPALRVAVPVVALGQEPDGTMQVPGDAKTVGWYTKAPTPGALGPAVLAGHVDFHRRPGTFARLVDLRAGDPVTVERQDGSVATFAVTKVEKYAKDRFPSSAVYGAIDHAGLRLITCGGDFDSGSGHYRDNIVVYAALQKADNG